MRLPILIAIAGCAMALTSSACTTKPAMGKNRDSGQSELMSSTFAGQNACNPENHLKPFIIEWDATDMSSFESHAANDIVVVRYEGCNLVVLDECRNESIRGEQGSYKPPEWTSGSLETIDISNEGELYAKLPLGAATLGGRVSGGERFHMEYYVAGKREATRDAVYRADIESNPGCEGATHFVHGFNLGAFALGSATQVDSKVGGSVYGFGAGGSTSSKRNAEKKGGDLGVCRSDSATEVAGCKAPIRLSLRKIRDGEDPNKEAMKAPDTADSLNAAGQLAAKLDMSDAARAHYESATAKANAKDGKGCLSELDKHAKADPKHPSTDPKTPLAYVRSQCLMLAGKCDAGKQLLRKAIENSSTAQFGEEMIDRQVEGYVQMYCQGKMSKRDELLKAWNDLSMAASTTKKDVAFCDAQLKRINTLAPSVEPKDGEDYAVNAVKNPEQVQQMHLMCMARAGACDKVWKEQKKVFLGRLDEGARKYYDGEPAKLDEAVRGQYDALYPKCKGKGGK